MDKKGEGDFGGLLQEYAVYLLLLAIAIIILFAFVSQQKEGAGFWEDYYAKEIAKIIDSAEPVEEVALDVHKATQIARKNQIGSFGDIFNFDSINNEICVKLSVSRKSCYSYWREIEITGDVIELAGYEGRTNILHFKIVEKRKKNE